MGRILTPQQRVDRYAGLFEKRPPLQCVDGVIYGIWMIGARYERASDCYGAYPHGFLERLLAIFPDKPRLHLFSGRVRDPESVTFDIRPAGRPDVLGDVMRLSHYFGEQFAVVFADPPYNAKARKIYGTKPFDKRLAVKQVHQVLRPGGHLLWLDTMTPMWSREEWEWAGLVGVHTGTNCVIRGLSIWRKRQR